MKHRGRTWLQVAARFFKTQHPIFWFSLLFQGICLISCWQSYSYLNNHILDLGVASFVVSDEEYYSSRIYAEKKDDLLLDTLLMYFFLFPLALWSFSRMIVQMRQDKLKALNPTLINVATFILITAFYLISA